MTTGAAALFFVVGAGTTALVFLVGLVPCAVALGIGLRMSRTNGTLKKLLSLRQEWDAEQVEKKRDLEASGALFDYTADEDRLGGYIDDQTWSDLNMDQLYARIDRTLTDPGEAVLYDMLRQPSFDRDEVLERSRVADFFEAHPKQREDVQLALQRLGHQGARNSVCSMLWEMSEPRERLRGVTSALALVALLLLIGGIVSVFVWSPGALMAVVGIFMVNMAVHYMVTRDVEQGTQSLAYLLGCIGTAGRLSAVAHPDIASYTITLRRQHEECKGIVKKSRWLFASNLEITDPTGGFAFLWQFVNIFFLIQARGIHGTRQELWKRNATLRELYRTIGELDALQSVASFRASLASYSVPDLVDGKPCLELVNAAHPLVFRAVPASIRFRKNIVMITGSNMGGKSTFLRNVGTNVLLAQTIATTITSRYRGTPFRIITSISRTDDVVAGKSFYFAEAERILDAIDGITEDLPSLCIIDELLAGTNATERRQASGAIVRYLAGQNAISIVATHDTELASELGDTCDFYHFADDVDENGLRFDYQLKPGVATTRNAIALLRYLGYPKVITDPEGR